MKSYWNWSAKINAILIGGVLIVFLIASIVMYKEPFIFLIFIAFAIAILFGYRNKYLYVEINGDEIILKKLLKTTFLHKSEIEAYSEWDRQYGKSGKYKELILYTNSESYTILGGFFNNYDDIRANLITPKLENRTQLGVEKAIQQARWSSIIFFILAIVFSYIAYKETQRSVIDEKDVKTIRGELSFYPEYGSRKKGKTGRAYYLVLQIKDCNRFFHINQTLLDNMPKLPPPPVANKDEISSTKPPIEYTPFSYLNIKDSVEILYIDRHTSKELKAQVYGLRHGEQTYFWKNWTEIKNMIDAENDTLIFAVLSVLSVLLGLSIALGYTSKWFSSISV